MSLMPLACHHEYLAFQLEPYRSRMPLPFAGHLAPSAFRQASPSTTDAFSMRKELAKLLDGELDG